ncbi:MAG: CoA pyrophosphatase [Spirochaetales bacterium]|uniref:CoA pyrophosphatase n=1 Tax=Candidatus Thalassospirochaeta sargassi TaxID=3119039 RepID=A0AAJ1IIJ4_9SPIO|nr:CoA pyrophosphatase [Spirochaetales bacterium]
MTDMYTKLSELIGAKFSGCGERMIGSEESFRSAVLVPFLNINGEESILFEKRSADIRQGGEICFPGGMVDEDDETTIETVIRETIEETGIDRNLIEVNGKSGHLATGIGTLIDVYLGRMDIKSLEELSPNPREVDRLFSVPVSFFMETSPEYYNYRTTVEPWYYDEEGRRVDLFPAHELGLPERYHRPWSHTKNRFVVYKYDGEVIWGITARIMNTVSKLMKKAAD